MLILAAYCALRCFDRLECSDVTAGESLLILPSAGHAVLTGDFKIVLAGEWHHRGEEGADAAEQAAARAAALQRQRRDERAARRTSG